MSSTKLIPCVGLLCGPVGMLQVEISHSLEIGMCSKSQWWIEYYLPRNVEQSEHGESFVESERESGQHVDQMGSHILYQNRPTDDSSPKTQLFLDYEGNFQSKGRCPADADLDCNASKGQIQHEGNVHGSNR